MIQTLAEYDSITAAGILARMALALDDEGNPASRIVMPGESIVRQQVLHEVKSHLGLSQDDNSEESLERVSAALDAESDCLYGSVDVETTLKKLSEKGTLPSDLFYVQVNDNVKDFYGSKFEAELKDIESTVALPDREEHFGGKDDEKNAGGLFSLFTKRFINNIPIRNYTLLVMGQRRGTLLIVNHAWRIYDDKVDLTGTQTLVDVVKRFGEVYGLEIAVEGERGKFIIHKASYQNTKANVKFEILPVFRPDQKGKLHPVPLTFEMTCFTLASTNFAEMAIVAVDMVRYRKSLQNHGW